MKPRLLDLFCGAGGATKGYMNAGFHVTGVDINTQPRYCGDEFVHCDALEYLERHGREFDVIHASPPCQAYAQTKSLPTAKPSIGMVPQVRAALVHVGKPYIIENVPGAPLIDPVILCGSMFGLSSGEAELRRHRLFESSVALRPPGQCNHNWKPRTIGVYGNTGGKSHQQRPKSTTRRDNCQGFSQAQRSEAMGIDWMTSKELSQAIPPDFTEWIGRIIMDELQ